MRHATRSGRRLRRDGAAGCPSQAKKEIADVFVSSSAGIRYLFLASALVSRPGRSHYKVGEGVRCLGPLNVEILQRAIGEFIERDKSLRTGIGKDDGKPWAEHLPV
jgi:hypothetical protein